MFKKLKELLIAPRSANPLGLTDGTVRQLKRLRSNEEWDAYLSTIDAAIKLNSEALLASRDAYSDTYYKGVVAGLRKAGTLVDEIIAKEREIVEHQRRVAEQQNARGNGAGRSAALFGTPAWPSRPMEQRPKDRG